MAVRGRPQIFLPGGGAPPGDGLGAIEEAVAVRRRLAAPNPAVYEPALADSLNNLSNGLGELIVANTRDGLAAARARGRQATRRRASTD